MQLLCSFLLFAQFAMVEVLVTSFMDEFYQNLIKFFKRKELFVLAVCGAAFLLGIPLVMQVQTVFDWINFNQSMPTLLNSRLTYLLF